MELQPAPTKSALRGRLLRYWNGRGAQKRELRQVVDTYLLPIGDVAIFGGMIRDLARAGADSFRSDIDLVVATDEPDRLEYVARQLNGVPNRFGGWRLRTDYWYIDVWPILNTWAFCQGHVVGSQLEDLTRTTFFNWDAAIFNLKTNKLHVCDDYLSAIHSRLLDINLAANPNPAGMVARTWAMMRDFEVTLTPYLANYVAMNLEKHFVEILKRYCQAKKHGWNTEVALYEFRDRIERHIELCPLEPFSLPPRQPKLKNFRSVS